MVNNIRHITNYMFEYDTNVPSEMVVGVFIFVCFINFLLFRVKTSYSIFLRQSSFCLLMGYIFLVLCTTILLREETFEKRYNIRPLLSYTMLDNRMLAQLILNIMMFVPIGFFAGGALKKKHIWYIIGIGFVLSLFIELTQLITTRGVFNVDDIIHNVLGCIIGFSFFVLCYKLIKRFA